MIEPLFDVGLDHKRNRKGSRREFKDIECVLYHSFESVRRVSNDEDSERRQRVKDARRERPM